MRTLALLVLSGCASLTPFEPYYATWDPPTISSLSSDGEEGNIGGSTITIEGSGFGDDPDELVVQFGDDNATIVSAEDGLLTVVVPPGPISGGEVDVRVATRTGTATAEAAYTYDVGDLYDSQVGHVQVNNFWESCYGGLSTRTDDEYGSVGCTDFAYIGYTGMDGVAEMLGFEYPRLHAENIGFFGGTDQAGSEWVVERPGQMGYVFGVDDLHEDIGEVTLYNSKIWEGEYYCPDLDSLAVYRYGGGTEGFLDPVSVAAADVVDGDSCEEGDEGARPLEELHFCTQPTVEGGPDYIYRPDWPIAKNFFAGKRNDWTVPAEITFTAPEVGITGTELDVPESLVVYATEGMEPLTEEQEAAEGLWSLSNFEGCFDESGDGETLDDVAVTFAWTPSTVSDDDGSKSCEEPGDVCAQSTYVRLTLTVLSLNWFGGAAYPFRATIVVPDDNEYSDDDERSHLSIPASVMYQIPTVKLPVSGGFGGDTSLLDPEISNWGYVITTFERVTDYSILTEDGKHAVVFSYTTGDFGFFGWENPTESTDGCGNCLDDDGDGWADNDDPDCEASASETGLGDAACNDGVDNDADGLADAEDPDCEDGSDTDESNCSNGEDDDGDRLEDEEDPECLLGLSESNSCGDDIDGDGDGWTDLEDPDCPNASFEESGYGDTVCNDGDDNDKDGTIDADDPECESADDEDEAG